MPPPPHATSLSSSSSTTISAKSWTNTALRALISFLSPILPAAVIPSIETGAVSEPTHKFDMGLPIIIRDRAYVSKRQLLSFAPIMNRSSFRTITTTSLVDKDGVTHNVVVAKPPPTITSRMFSTSVVAAENVGDEVNINRSSLKQFSSVSSSKLSSSRAHKATSFLPSYLLDARSIQKYHPVSSPEGALQLSVAENQLSEVPLKNIKLLGSSSVECDVTLMDVLSTLASSNAPKPSQEDDHAPQHVFDREMIYYQPTQGTEGLRKIMGDYLKELLLPASSRPFNTDNLILGAGCNAVLENLCMTLTDPGEAVMIPTPYYAAFEFDLGARAGCVVVPVNTMEFHPTSHDDHVSADCYCPNKASLDHAYERAVRETGRPPRVLLLSHPNNPLGVCYPPSVMKECIDWCREKEVHLISDEIYAGSVYRQTTPEATPTFISAMSLASNPSDSGLGLGPYIHLVYALSKDFALSGLRVGVAYTENEEILFALQKLNDFCQISSHTQLLVERMLTAQVERNGVVDKFVNVYLEENNQNIQSRSDKLVQCLEDLEIPYLQPDSGLFLWMDFREFLPQLPVTESPNNESLESKEKRERELYLSLMKEHGLLFTPGMSMRNEKPGFFRCVFTAANEEEFELGLVRIQKFVKSRRRGLS